MGDPASGLVRRRIEVSVLVYREGIVDAVERIPAITPSAAPRRDQRTRQWPYCYFRAAPGDDPIEWGFSYNHAQDVMRRIRKDTREPERYLMTKKILEPNTPGGARVDYREYSPAYFSDLTLHLTPGAGGRAGGITDIPHPPVLRHLRPHHRTTQIASHKVTRGKQAAHRTVAERHYDATHPRDRAQTNTSSPTSREVSLMSNGKPNFLITQDTRAAWPGDARYMLRTENRQITGLEQYVGSNRPSTARVMYDQSVLTIPDDAALVMIGNTKELADACAEAEHQGIGRIETVNELPLKRHYVRMEISTFQDDTLIIICSQDYWAKLGSGPPDLWKQAGGQDQDYVNLYDLCDLVHWIKDHDDKPTVDKEGRALR